MPDPNVVQVWNPRGYWVMVDRGKGCILGQRPGPWPDVPKVGRRPGEAAYRKAEEHAAAAEKWRRLSAPDA